MRSMHHSRLLTLVTPFLLLTGCGGGPPRTPDANPGPTVGHSSTSADRESVALTVYNGNFGLVREVRNVTLSEGRVSLDFRDVAEHIQPETVAIKSLSSPGGLNVFEQNYRYDLLTPQKLLEKYVGKKVKLHRYSEKLGTEQTVDAEVVSFNEGQPIFKIDGEVTYGYGGRVSFPEVPSNLIARPTLALLLGSSVSRQKIELTYVTQQLSWSSDYVLTIDDQEKSGDLVGWVTLRNTSGASFENAKLKLVAGDVQRVASRDATKNMLAKAEEAKDDNDFKEEGFFEYHLYTLGRPTTVLDKEQKQVVLEEATGIRLDKRLIFSGTPNFYRQRFGGEVTKNQKVGVYLDIQNRADNHLGMPLPKGVVRVYKADSSGAKQFIGEDTIDHTPRDEKIRIKMGEAFDVVGDRKQMAWHALDVCRSETDWEISLRNHKDVAAEVLDVEPVGGDWTIVRSSHEATRKDAQTFTFTVNVPARGETKITYSVRVRWC
jgi:hypothetical protein